MCSKQGRIIQALGTDGFVAGAAIKSTGIREFYRKNRTWSVVLALITVVSPIAGIFMAGFLGLVAGLLLGGLGCWLGPKAVLKVREISRD